MISIEKSTEIDNYNFIGAYPNTSEDEMDIDNDQALIYKNMVCVIYEENLPPRELFHVISKYMDELNLFLNKIDDVFSKFGDCVDDEEKFDLDIEFWNMVTIFLTLRDVESEIKTINIEKVLQDYISSLQAHTWCIKQEVVPHLIELGEITLKKYMVLMEMYNNTCKIIMPALASS